MFQSKYDRLFREAFDYLNQSEDKDRQIAHEVVEGVRILQFNEALVNRVARAVIQNKRFKGGKSTNESIH